MKKLIEMSVRLWSVRGGGGDGGVGVLGVGAGLCECVWMKVGQGEQPILSGEKMSWMPAANECTVNVGKTTRNQQSEINEFDQQNCFQNVGESEEMSGTKIFFCISYLSLCV